MSILPLALFSSMMMVETIALSWVSGKFTDGIVWRLIFGATVPFVGIFLWIIISPTLDNLGRRTLEFGDKWLVVQPHRVGRIPWNCVVALQLEPLTGDPDLALLNVVSKPTAKRRLPRKWSIVLDRAKQVPLLLAELQLRGKAMIGAT